MSREKVEVVRKVIEAFASGRPEDALTMFDPEVQWQTAADEPDATTPYHGLTGIQELWATWGDIWAEGFERVALEAFEAAVRRGEVINADPHVIVPLMPRLRGRASGAEVEVPETYVLTFREGKIIRVAEYRTKQEALEAVGLRE